MRILVAFLLVIVRYSAFSQTPIKLPEVIGPSPNAASIQKYGDYKVSTYTGIPDISIPIYTIQLRDKAIPISISYNASGIKVGEESSRIGLGWTLNAGGIISRNILGLDDLWPYSLNPTSFDLIGTPERPVINSLQLPFAGYTYDITNDLGLTVDQCMPNIAVDLEPDIFYFNFLGYNGKFVLQKKDTTAILQDPSSNLKIKFNIAPYNLHDSSVAAIVGLNCTIDVTSSDGTLYSFGQFESCQSVGGDITIPNHITAWYLTKISTARGTTVNFNYTQSATGFTSTLNEPSFSKSPLPSPGTDTSIHRSIIPHKNYRNILLTSITSNICNVYLNYDSRLDVQGDKRLSSIRIEDSRGKVVKTVNLIQDYFVANSPGINTFDLETALWGGPLLDSNWITKKLRLSELQEVSNDGLTILPHKFKYNDSLMPLKNSTSRDHWGYFNNASNGGNLIPDLAWSFPGLFQHSTPPSYNCTPTWPGDFSSSNVIFAETTHRWYMHSIGVKREIDTNYSQAGMLDTIFYPTGGYSKFTFEQNTYDKNKSFAQDLAATAYDYSPVTKSFGLISGVTAIPAGFSQSFTFDIAGNDTLPGEGGALFKLQLKATKGANVNTTVTTNTVISLKNAAGVILEQITFNAFNNLIDNGNGTYSSAFLAGTLPLGTYTLQITFGGNPVDRSCVLYNLIGTWPVAIDSNTDGIKYKYAGGLRIKNILSYTGDGQLADSINYTYHYITDSNNNQVPEIRSTGKLMERPSYFSQSIASDHFDFALKSETGAKATVGYDSVIVDDRRSRRSESYQNTCYRPNVYKMYYTVPGAEMMPGGIGTGWYVEEESNIGAPNNFLWLNVYFDYRPSGVNNFTDNANGKLTKEVDYKYDSASDAYQAVKSIENIYKSNGTGTAGVVWADRMYVPVSYPLYTCLQGLPPMYGAVNFFYPALSSYAPLLLRSTETQYGSNINDSNVKAISYDYNNRNLVNQVSRMDSKGDTILSLFNYPFDYSAPPGSVLDNVLKANLIGAPVEQRLLRKNLVTSGMYLRFDTIGRYTLPATYYNLDIGFPQNINATTPSGILPSQYVKKETILYDPFANIEQVNSSDGLATSFIWDSLDVQPLAKVIGSVRDDVAFTSFEIGGDGNWNVSSLNRESTAALTGNQSYNMINGCISKAGLTSGKEYVVSYWGTGGACLINGGSSSTKTGKSVNGWTYYEQMVTLSGNSITLTGSGNIDELRLYPSGSQMTSYTYKPLIGVGTIDDVAGHITYYQYDSFGRLSSIKDEDGNIIKTIQYHYKEQRVP